MSFAANYGGSWLMRVNLLRLVNGVRLVRREKSLYQDADRDPDGRTNNQHPKDAPAPLHGAFELFVDHRSPDCSSMGQLLLGATYRLPTGRLPTGGPAQQPFFAAPLLMHAAKQGMGSDRLLPRKADRVAQALQSDAGEILLANPVPGIIRNLIHRERQAQGYEGEAVKARQQRAGSLRQIGKLPSADFPLIDDVQGDFQPIFHDGFLLRAGKAREVRRLEIQHEIFDRFVRRLASHQGHPQLAFRGTLAAAAMIAAATGACHTA